MTKSRELAESILHSQVAAHKYACGKKCQCVHVIEEIVESYGLACVKAALEASEKVASSTTGKLLEDYSTYGYDEYGTDQSKDRFNFVCTVSDAIRAINPETVLNKMNNGS